MAGLAWLLGLFAVAGLLCPWEVHARTLAAEKSGGKLKQSEIDALLRQQRGFTMAEPSPLIPRQNTDAFCKKGSRLTRTAESGEISDKVTQVQQNYPNLWNCAWIIDVSAGGEADITFEFTQLDLEERYDFVAFAIGRNPYSVANQVLWFSGRGPNLPPRFTVNSSIVSVLFYTDQLINGAGFRLNYYAQRCTDDCNGHGVCQNGACVCDNAWRGEACELSYCPNNGGDECGAHGHCKASQPPVCVCEDGYYGWDCDAPYCSAAGGTHLLTGSKGTFQDHFGGGEYLNGMHCTWNIQPAAFFHGDSIILTFKRLDTEENFDYVSVWDGTHLIGRFSGHDLPPRLIGTSSLMKVLFETDQGLARTGFQASWELVRCPNACNDKGVCVGPNQCHCEHGWTGSNCSATECLHDCWSSDGAGSCVNDRCVCNVGFEGGDCGVCTSASSCAGTSASYCAGGPVVLDPSRPGNFSDHIGFGQYQPSSDCSWSVDASSLPNAAHSSLDVSFAYFELEAESEVSLGAGTNRATYHGPTDRAPFFSVPASNPLTVSFHSGASTATGRGFRALYSTSECTSGCVNGDCVRGGCECHAGFTGADCNTRTCTNEDGTECSAHGICSSQQICSCDPGWFGSLCETSYCTGETVIIRDSGEVEDHGTGSYYMPNSNCSFLLEPNAAGPIGITFFEFAMEWFRDYVTVYDGPTMNSPRLLNFASGSFLPHPIRSTSNSVLIHFVTNQAFELTGWKAFFASQSKCPNSCSGRGVCYKAGKCLCDAGFSGADCANAVVPQKLPLNENITRPVGKFEWHYWQIDVPADTKEMIVHHHMISGGDTGGHVEFFVKANAIPTLADHDAASSYWGPEQVRITAPSSSLYFLGAYAREAAQVKVRAEVPVEPSTTSSATASPNNVPAVFASSGSASGGDNSWAVPLVIVLLVLLGLTLVGVAYLWYRRKLQGRRSVLALGQRDWTNLVDEVDSTEDDDDDGSDNLSVELED